MLLPPNKGFAVSVNAHNVELDAMAEWLEANITFSTLQISMPEVKDELFHHNYYRSQDFAQARIDDCWNELRRRKRALGKVCPFDVNGTRLTRTKNWRDVPSYAFCLMVALQVPYRDAFKTKFGTDYNDQGALFERLTAEALEQLGWRTHSTAWSHNASDSIVDRVTALAAHLGEAAGISAVDKWSSDQAKDEGLDVVCHLPFPDGWSGRPLFFVQCASGENWKGKRSTPNLDLWMKLLDLATWPRRGIAHPFALLEDEFRRTANFDRLSLVLDRHRLSHPRKGLSEKWTSLNLAKDLKAWTKRRLAVLKSLDAD